MEAKDPKDPKDLKDLKDPKDPKDPKELNDQDVVFIDEGVETVHVDCTLFVRDEMERLTKHIQHSDFKIWPPTGVACLHDCHPFNSVPIPLVHKFDERKSVYHVYGVFCSPNCAKAYVIEHESGLVSRRMADFLSMLRNVYGIGGNIKPAPPRIRLRMFGGELDIETFRTQFKHVHEAILSPPFVPSVQVIRSSQITRNVTTVPHDNEPKRASNDGRDGKPKATKDEDVDMEPTSRPEKRKRAALD